MSNKNNIPKIIQLDANHPQALLAGMIHLYVISVADMQHVEAELVSYINQDEEARANRFINPQHGQQYRCIRGMLRKLLAYYLGSTPSKIQFEYAEHGKPLLKDNSNLHFNLSHSRDMAAFAFKLEHEVGVDIEYMRPQKDLLGMMRHVGSVKEQAELKNMGEADARQAFYRLWTRKEAFIKAVGRGLGMGLRSIYIGTTSSVIALPVKFKEEFLPEWFIQDLSAPQDYKLAVCSRYK